MKGKDVQRGLSFIPGLSFGKLREFAKDLDESLPSSKKLDFNGLSKLLNEFGVDLSKSRSSKRFLMMKAEANIFRLKDLTEVWWAVNLLGRQLSRSPERMDKLAKSFHEKWTGLIYNEKFRKKVFMAIESYTADGLKEGVAGEVRFLRDKEIRAWVFEGLGINEPVERSEKSEMEWVERFSVLLGEAKGEVLKSCRELLRSVLFSLVEDLCVSAHPVYCIYQNANGKEKRGMGWRLEDWSAYFALAYGFSLSVSAAARETRMGECGYCGGFIFKEHARRKFCNDKCRYKAWKKKHHI